MTSKVLATIWTGLAPALADHLWQSTVFACAAALLTLVLRKNRARTRYTLWLAASMKFLIPFSLLVSIGSQLVSPRPPAPTKTGLYLAMEEVGQPFTSQAIAKIPYAAPSTIYQSMIHLFPGLLVAWLCGFAAVLLVWCVRWCRISATARKPHDCMKGANWKLSAGWISSPDPSPSKYDPRVLL